MAHHHFPGGLAGRQAGAEPGQLLGPVGIHVGIQHEKFHWPAAQVVPAAGHAEGAIGHLGIAIGRADVVVAEHRVEGHPGLEQGAVGAGEGAIHLADIAIVVDVVAGQDHQIHRLAPLHGRHLIGDRLLLAIAAAAIRRGQPAQLAWGWAGWRLGHQRSGAC